MSSYKKLLKNLKLQKRLFNAIKEIELDELADVYYKMTHKYLGYDEHTISIKYFNNDSYLFLVKSFDDFVAHFKCAKYKII